MCLCDSLSAPQCPVIRYSSTSRQSSTTSCACGSPGSCPISSVSCAPSAMVPCAPCTKCSRKWAGEIWPRAPSFTVTPTTRPVPCCRIMAMIWWSRSAIRDASCMVAHLVTPATFTGGQRQQLLPHPCDDLRHGRCNGCRKAGTRLEGGPFHPIDHEHRRQLPQGAGEFDRLCHPEG